MVDGMYHSPKISYEISWLCSTGSCSMLECCFVSGLSCFCHRFPPHIHSSSARAAAPKLGSSRWPWIFEEPRRVSELPEEEKFSGFGGLDELFIGDSQPDLQADSQPCHQFKVPREIRRAYYTPISLDSAPNASLVALSETGAAITGIPRNAVQVLKSQYYVNALRGSGADGVSSPTRMEDLYNSAFVAENEGKPAISEDDLNILALALTGTNLMHGSHPYASCYGGHQFGNWAGQLGDGRVATLGDIRVGSCQENYVSIPWAWNGSLVEIQLKGIGKTPFSRGGDGKAVLRSCLREYLFSEALAGLGLSSAVAVSVCATGEAVLMRDPRPELMGALVRTPGAVLCRTAPSFLRFGSFELPARRGEVEFSRQLAEYCIRHLGPHLGLCHGDETMGSASYMTAGIAVGRERRAIGLPGTHSEEDGARLWACDGETEGLRSQVQHPCRNEEERETRHLQLLISIIQATARMVASWQAIGFCHGVLNTDNFSVLGLALDFGPCSFMGKYNPSWSPNKGDSAFRYTFRNQPDVSAWNCERLAEAFSSLVGYSGIACANKVFSPAFDEEYTSLLQRKLGLTSMELGGGWVDTLRCESSTRSKESILKTPDAQFVLELFRLMADSGTDFTETWRALVEVPALSVARSATNPPSSGTPSTSKGPCKVYTKSRAGTTELSEKRRKDSVHDVATCKSGTPEDADNLGISDDKILRPLSSVLIAAQVSRVQAKDWGRWIRRFMARIDSHGIGRSHPDGKEAGQKQRMEVMRRSNPAFVLRESAMSKALEAADQGGAENARFLTNEPAAKAKIANMVINDGTLHLVIVSGITPRCACCNCEDSCTTLSGKCCNPSIKTLEGHP